MTYILLVGGFGLVIVAVGLHRLNQPQCRSHIWTMTSPMRCTVCRRYMVPTWKRWWSTARQRLKLVWLRWHWRR